MSFLWKWRAFYLKGKMCNVEGIFENRFSPSHNDQKAPPERIIISKLLAYMPKKTLLITVSGVPFCSVPHLNKGKSLAVNQFANMGNHLRSRCLCSSPLICTCCLIPVSQFPCPCSTSSTMQPYLHKTETTTSRCPASANKLASGEGTKVQLRYKDVNTPFLETEHITFTTLRSKNIKLFLNFPLSENAVMLINLKIPLAAIISFFYVTLKTFLMVSTHEWKITVCYICVTSNTHALTN